MKTIWNNNLVEYISNQCFRMYWKAFEWARGRSFKFLVFQKHGQCKTNLIYLIFENTAINTKRKWLTHFFLVKKDMLKVWCKFNQNLFVFIEGISIWNLKFLNQTRLYLTPTLILKRSALSSSAATGKRKMAVDTIVNGHAFCTPDSGAL